MDDLEALRQRVHGIALTAASSDKPKGKRTRRFEESQVVRDTDPGQEGQFAPKSEGNRSSGGDRAQRKKERDAQRRADKAEKAKKAAANSPAGKAAAAAKRKAETERKRKEREAARKAETEKKRKEKEAKAAAHLPEIKTASGRSQALAKAEMMGWTIRENPDGSAVISTPDGPVKIPGDTAYGKVTKAANGMTLITDKDGNVTALPPPGQRRAARREAERHSNESIPKMDTIQGRDEVLRLALRRGWKITENDDGSARVVAPGRGTIHIPPDEAYGKIDSTDKGVTVTTKSGSKVTLRPIAQRAAQRAKEVEAEKESARAQARAENEERRKRLRSMTSSSLLAPRREAAIRGWALPDGSFPIRDESDLRKAIVAAASAPNSQVVQAHIERRAAALGVDLSA